MQNSSTGTFTLIRYNFLVRETLEYCVVKPEYKKELYQMRKAGLSFEISNPTLLKRYLDDISTQYEEQAKEGKLNNVLDDEGNLKPEPFNKLIKDLISEIYSDDSTVVHLAEDGLRVDQAQHLKIYEYVIPVHEQIQRIIRTRIKYAKEKNILEPALEDLVNKDERMYRAVVFEVTSNDLEKLFVEFGKAMAESKGQPTPQSNFVQNDINRIVGLINFVRNNGDATIIDTDYHEVSDYYALTIDMVYHKRELPEGKHFKDIFAELHQKVRAYLNKTTQLWIAAFSPMEKEFEEYIKENQAKAQANKTLEKGNNPIEDKLKGDA